jgi:CRISPR-associated endoribonuclease Cas6
MPTRWELHLAADKDAEKPVTPAQLHGLAAALLEGRQADHHAQTKRYSVSPLLAGDQPGVAVLRLGWLADDRPLNLGILTGRRVRLGPQFFTVCDAQPAGASYGELLEGQPAIRAVIDFMSTTYFSRSGVWYPLPDPRLIYSGLIRRWNCHAPPFARIKEDDGTKFVGRVAISGLDICSSAIDPGSGHRIGFTGTCAFILPGTFQPADGVLLAALTRFALASGIGAQTTHGLGHVEATISTKPPTAT